MSRAFVNEDAGGGDALGKYPLPGPGDRISAAGPVYQGSYGQRQIQAIELHVAR